MQFFLTVKNTLQNVISEFQGLRYISLKHPGKIAAVENLQ